MTAPVRTPFFVAAEYGDKPIEEWLLRDALEYYKRGIKVVMKYQPVGPLEQRVIDEAWVGVVAVIAKREKIPAGPLSYFLGEAALTELKLAEAAQEEYEVARGYDPE